jgi:hypothetical protein
VPARVGEDADDPAVGSQVTKGIPRDTDFLAEADARISAVRSGMGEEAWKEALAEGRAMTLDEAVSYALEEEEAGA